MQAIVRNVIALGFACTMAAVGTGCAMDQAEPEGSTLARISGDGSINATVSGTGSDGLRIRAEANTSSDVLGMLGEGASIKVVSAARAPCSTRRAA